jgi:polyphosphate kinase
MKGNLPILQNNYINRELSWLEFNERVLEEAYDTGNPLFERLKFASIVSSNLDEFFMVRVASLHDQILAGFHETDLAGLTPREQIDSISERVHLMVRDQYSCYNRSLVPALKKEKIYFYRMENLTDKQKQFVENHFNKMVYPVLTPMVVDQSRPFPLILNKSLNIALLLKNPEEPETPVFATIQVPSVLERLVAVPCEEGEKCFVFLEDIIKMHMTSLFAGHEIITMSCYRITRNADQGLDEEGAEDLLEAIEQFLKKRRWGAAIRLEIENDVEERLLDILQGELEVQDGGIYRIKGPLDLTILVNVSNLSGYGELKFPVFRPQPSQGFMEMSNIFEAFSQRDILVHHPYETFDPVVELVRQAASDPQVLAIKQTLYRVSGKSPIVEALAQAAENGKQVTVLVELKARFDEQNNIIWAKRLEMAGCHVIYGLVGVKIHCKVLLIVRREEDGIKRYVHMGTGNYNDVTARFYTDLGVFTSNPYYGADASALFNMLSGYSQLTQMYKVDIAPISLRTKFLNMIQRETENAAMGKRAGIIAKMNSLVDEKIIYALYEASNAGVDIELIIRGVCCLRPGIPGLSERICVKSIVGRYLEHSRIYYFYNDGDGQYFLSSADWMGRNLDRRVELLFPVEDPTIQERIQEILSICLKDTVKARVLKSDGTYTKIDKRGKESINSQEYFYKQAVQRVKEACHEGTGESFKPNMAY